MRCGPAPAAPGRWSRAAACDRGASASTARCASCRAAGRGGRWAGRSAEGCARRSRKSKVSDGRRRIPREAPAGGSRRPAHWEGRCRGSIRAASVGGAAAGIRPFPALSWSMASRRLVGRRRCSMWRPLRWAVRTRGAWRPSRARPTRCTIDEARPAGCSARCAARAMPRRAARKATTRPRSAVHSTAALPAARRSVIAPRLASKSVSSSRWWPSAP
mmetsp:Transcript_26150/g.76446  ORF Transcript_26150/g.76446 Transcript_26150/m.76446 type:complete len:217 (-) Transcript_26150:10-660(-)